MHYGWATGQSTPTTETSAAGDNWVRTGFVITATDGSPPHPADVTDHFRFLLHQAGLPPIRLHDLRHTAATIALAAGIDITIVQTMLRHADCSTTSNMYTSVLPEVAHGAVENSPLQSPGQHHRFSGAHQSAMNNCNKAENIPKK